MNMKQMAFAVCVSIPPPALANCSTGPITVIGKTAYPPVSFTKENKLIGLGYSVIKQIAESQGLEVKVSTPAPWKRVVHRGRIGEVDIVIGLRATNLSKDHFVFLPTPIIESAQNIIFLKGNELR
ncbi:MAG: transporter substrate-binding domain-containing protein, partial [Flavobacteriales bacterium]|nr:transporter substrate-binding domain-containing protein [Flavobacteriales bacterium]